MELPMWGKAISYAEKAKDTLAVINFLDHSSSTYYMLGDKEKALETDRDVYQRNLSIGRTADAAGTLMTAIDSELKKG